MRRYSPIVILLTAIGFVFTLSKIYAPELNARQTQKNSNTNNSNNKDIALSSIKESFSNLLNFEVNLRKKKQEEHVSISNKTNKMNPKTVSTQTILDTVKSNDVITSPILMLDDLMKNEKLNSSE